MLSFGKTIISPRLIGRAAEVEWLEQVLQTAHKGQGQCVLLAGEAGVGKSRLAAETKARAVQLGFVVLQGACFEPDQGLPYGPLIELWRAYLADHSPGEVAELLGPTAVELVKLLPELGGFLSSFSPGPSLEPEQEKRRLFEALAHGLRHLAGSTGNNLERPLLLIIEDLHWSDDTTLEFLLFLARRMATKPLLLLLTYRHDETQPSLYHFLAELERTRLAAEIVLSRLTPAEVEAMIRAIFELAQPVRNEFLEAIYGLTEGNPFFVEEILKSLVVAGEIFYSLTGWTRRPLHELHIPRTIQDAVQRRIRQLSEAAQQLLGLAAVVGRRFDFGLLRELTGHAEAELLQQVKELMAAQLVVEESAETCAFRHALTQQAVYLALLARERQPLHRRVAETIERLYPQALEAHLAELAHHFYEAGVWEKALTFARLAGEKAQAMHASRAAIEHFSRALDAAQRLSLTPPDGLLRARGQAYERSGNFEAARADYTTALAQARDAGEVRSQWQAWLDLGFLWVGRDFGQAGGCFREALALAQRMNDPAILAHTLNRVGNWYLMIEQPLEAWQRHEEALHIFRGLNDRRGLAETLDLLGTTALSSHNLIRGMAYYEQAIVLFRELNNRPGLASSLAMRALGSGQYLSNVAVGAETNRSAECLRDADEALKIVRELGWRSGEALTLTVIGLTWSVQGDYGRALAAMQAGLDIAVEIEHHQWTLLARLALGTLYLDLLALPAAKTQLEQALELAQSSGSLYWRRTVAGFLACTYIQQSELDRAAGLLAEVLAADTPQVTTGQRQAWCAQAELALARKNPAQALEIVGKLIASAQNIEAQGPHAIPRLARLRGEALAALGRATEAETALKGGREVVLRRGLRGMAWRIHETLSRLYREQRRYAEAEGETAAARHIVEELAASISDESLRENFRQNAAGFISPAPKLTPRRAAKEQFGGLTDREREVATLISQGKSNQAIAAQLVLSERTVEKHVENIMSKLGFAARTQIAAWVVEKGLANREK